MFGKIDKDQNNQQPAAKDDNVRQEARLEEQGVQPMGNEAVNVELMNQMLREANADNMLDIPGYEDMKEEAVPNNDNPRKILEEPGADDPNNSMYLDSSHNIVNDNNFINGVNVKDLQASAGKKKDNENKKALSGSEENLLEIDTRPHEIIEKEKQAKLAAKAAKAPIQNIIPQIIQAAVQQEQARPEFYVDPENRFEELEDP